MLQQAPEESLTPNALEIGLSIRTNLDLSLRGRLRDGSVLQAAMRPMLVVEADVLLANVIQMATAKTREMDQAFALERPDPCFNEGVGVRGQDRDLHAPQLGILEGAVECRCEL